MEVGRSECGLAWFKLIGSAVASGPRERLGVFGYTERKRVHTSCGKLGASCVVHEQSLL